MDVIHQRVAGLDVHKETIVACVRIMVDARVSRECRTFDTTTAGLKDLLAWLTASGCSHVAMEATGVTGSRCGTSRATAPSRCWWRAA